MAEEVTTGIGASLFDTYNVFVSSFPDFLQGFMNLFFIVLLILIYAIIIWKFYKSISKRDIVKLDLNQYNKFSGPLFGKLVAVSLYSLEYLIIVPLLIFIGFSLFTFLLIFLTEDLSTGTLILVSATIITAIRMAAYYNEDLATDLAKLIPLTFLAVSLLNPSFFSIERIFGQFSEITQFSGDIFVYLFFIIIIEMLMRFFNFIFSIFGLVDDNPEEEEAKKKNS